MTNLTSFETVLNKALKDKEFKDLYSKELILNKIATAVTDMRQRAGLTQKELAVKANTTQQVVSRIESARDVSRIPSIDLLSRLAVASGCNMDINFKAF